MKSVAWMTVVGLLLSVGGVAQAGFIDSVSKSADSSGKYVEKSTGSRSDNKKFPIHRFPEPSLKIQLPAAYKIADKSKTSIRAVNKQDGVSMLIRFDSMKQEAGLNKFTQDKKTLQEAYKAGKYQRWKERTMNDVVGVETMKLNGKDRNSARTYQWQGYDSSRLRYITLTADFGANKYEGNVASDFDAALASIRWDYKK